MVGITTTLGGWPLVAAVVIQHGKQFTKLQLSDILYHTKSERANERGQEQVRQGTEPHIQKVMAVEWTLHWLPACLQFACMCRVAWLHWVINLKLWFGSFKYSISCEIFRLHRQRHCSGQCTCTYIHMHTHMNAYNENGNCRFLHIWGTFATHLPHWQMERGGTNLLKVLSM